MDSGITILYYGLNSVRSEIGAVSVSNIKWSYEGALTIFLSLSFPY